MHRASDSGSEYAGWVGAHDLIHSCLRPGQAWRLNRVADSRRCGEIPVDYCFPSRLEEIIVLEWALAKSSEMWMPCYLLGNLFYDRRRYEEAIQQWESAAKENPSFATVHRNLGIALFNVRQDPVRALNASKLHSLQIRAMHAYSTSETSFGGGPDDLRKSAWANWLAIQCSLRCATSCRSKSPLF